MWFLGLRGGRRRAPRLGHRRGSEGGGGGDAASGEPLTIGFSLSESGFNAAVSQEYLEGLQVWQQMINEGTGIYEGEEPGLLGRPVELVYSDDESNPEAALRIYERLMSQDQVDLLLAPYGSGSTGVVAPVTERQGYMLIAGSAASESIYRQEGIEQLLMVPAPISRWFGAVPELLAQQDLRGVFMVTLDNPATLDSAAFLSEAIPEQGGEVLGNEPFQIGNQDFTAIWTKVQAADPDAVILHAFGTDAVTAMRQAREVGVSPQMWAVFAGAWRDDVFRDGVGVDAAECVISDAHWNPSFPYEGNEAFVEAYVAEHGDPAESGAGSDASAAWGFASGQILAEAVRAVGEEGLEDQALLVDHLKDASLETVVGPWDVDEDGINTGAPDPALVQFQDGERTVIYPADLADSEFQPCGS